MESDVTRLQRNVGIGGAATMVGLLAIGLPLFLSIYADRTLADYFRTPQYYQFVTLVLFFGVSAFVRHRIGRIVQVASLLLAGLWNQMQSPPGSLTGVMIMGVGIILAAHYGFVAHGARAKMALIAVAMGASLLLQVAVWAESHPDRPLLIEFAYNSVAVLGLLTAYSLVIRDAAMSAARRRKELERDVSIRTEAYRQEVESRRVAEEAARTSAQEASRLAAERLDLLQEVQHRTKNSVQMTIALLESFDPNNPHDLDSIMNRVRAIGLVYDLVDSLEDLSSIPLEHYIERLVWYLQLSYHGREVCIRYEPGQSRTRSQLDATINLGMLLHEIVRTVVTYSLADEGGTITIRQETAAESVELVVTHGGCPLPAGIETDRTEGAADLLPAFLRRLHVGSTIERNATNHWRLSIPLEAIVKAAPGADVRKSAGPPHRAR